MSKLIHLLLSGLLVAGLGAPALAADDGADNERWQSIRKSLFADRPIATDATGVVELEAPVRAADAAVVPMAIRAKLPQTPERYIKKLWLVIDRNPSPVGVIFSLTPDSGLADIETRVRVEEYTHARAIAELNDGSLHMHTRFVKASGGCSAPAGKDAEAALANLGKTKLRVEGPVEPGKPALAQLMISHPQTSGLAIDQLTRLAPAPYFVRSIAISYGGKPVLQADVDFTVSENPSLRFHFLPREAGGQLKAEIVDTKDRNFTAAIDVNPKQYAQSAVR
jgi:sulfur-oxidizing protein SoxY